MEENEDKAQQEAKKTAENSVNRVSNSITKATVNTGKKTIKTLAKEITKVISTAIMSIIPIIIFAVVIIIIIAAFVAFLKEDDAEKLTGLGKSSINTILNISDISELVTINGTPQKGYSLAFVDDIDEKLTKVLKSDERYEDIGITRVDILKQYIKAELVTQLPYLGDGIEENKLPNLDGVDILYEPEETTGMLNSMEGVLMLGDSYTVGLNNSGMLKECTFRCENSVPPRYWLDETRLNDFPSEVTGVCVLLGVNDPSQISDMEQLIDKLCEKYPGKPIYVQKVFPLGRNYGGTATQSQINTFNQEIQKYCETKNNVFWIDTTSGYVDEVGYLITNDIYGLHLTDYQTWVSNIKSKILNGRETSSGVQLTGETVAEQIWSYFINEGFSEVATAAIMGNMEQESGGLNTDAVQKTGTGIGIVQWSEGRRTKFEQYCANKGVEWTDLETQLEYLVKECEEDQWLFADYWNGKFNEKGFDASCTFEEFKTCEDSSKIEYETYVFCAYFERCYVEDSYVDEVRVPKAKEHFENFTGTTPAASGTTKKAIAVTDREVSEENSFQPAIKLKRVIPDKQIGEKIAVNGKVIEMKYVPQGVFNAYLNQNNGNVLEVFTINNNREIVFAKWSCEDSVIKYTKASSVKISTVMEKYTMPYDYIMILNVYGDDVDFCLNLVNLALESKYVIAVQDQVTTTYTQINQTETVESTIEAGEDTNENEAYKTVSETKYYENSKQTEQVSEKIELTYADSWLIKIENEKTYLDDKYVERDPIDETYSETTSTEGNTTTTTQTSSVVNKYSSGKTTVYEDEAGDKFVEIYNKSKKFKLLEPNWLFEGLNSNAKTAKLVDITKYLLYKATHESYGVEKPGDAFRQYEDNEFKEIKKENKGTIGWDFTRAWENNELRKYMNDEGVDYDSSAYVYSCVTEDRSKYILHDEIGQAKGNKIYGIEVMSYDNENLGEKWQNVDLFQEQGINIKESEFNVYGESKIDVELIEKISIESAKKRSERIENIAKIYKLDLETNQIDCLADILYEKGDIYNIIKFIRDNNFDFKEMSKGELEDAKKQFQEKFDEFTGKRGEARWILLTEGRYCTPIEGEELDPSNYFGGGEILEVAEECWKWVCEHNPTYGATNIPPTGQIDCSGYVTWVLYEMGYTEFSFQHDTQWFIDNQESLKSKYDWEIIQVSAGENISGIVQPGDIIDRSVGTGANGHMNIAVSCENGQLLAYDCGSRSHWANRDGSPIDETSFLTNSRPGVIIRGVKAP